MSNSKTTDYGGAQGCKCRSGAVPRIWLERTVKYYLASGAKSGQSLKEAESLDETDWLREIKIARTIKKQYFEIRCVSISGMKINLCAHRRPSF
eukprot:scaffold213197_cov42-Cyclotella_meneghiniana.AAC.1